MSKNNDELLGMMEKLFDEKIAHLDGKLNGQMTVVNGKLDDLTSQIVGNGKKGLKDRVVDLELFNTRLIAIYSFLVLLITAFGVYIRGFVEALWQHLYFTGRG